MLFRSTLLALALTWALPLHAQQLALTSAGGDAWTFRKHIDGSVHGHCDDVMIVGPAATVVATRIGQRFSATLPLQEGENEVHAACHRGGVAVSLSEPQRWRVRLQDGPKAWPRIVPSHRGLVFDAGASQMGTARQAPIERFEWRVQLISKLRPEATAPVFATALGRRVDLKLPDDGEYRVSLTVTDALGRTDSAVAGGGG
ncbi:MAG TPA: hypothetical protein VHM01_24095, partial [Alphaproteobacteria bacterium]|nr:hypothetical protein [Alphaproteobacteria bacterium]